MLLRAIGLRRLEIGGSDAMIAGRISEQVTHNSTYTHIHTQIKQDICVHTKWRTFGGRDQSQHEEFNG